MEASKPVSAKGTGSLMLYKVDSGMIQKLQSIQDGQVPEFTVVSNLADPDSAGAERIAYYGVQFTDLTLADWQAATSGKNHGALYLHRLPAAGRHCGTVRRDNMSEEKNRHPVPAAAA